MTTRSDRPAWVRPFLGASRLALGLYPAHLRDEVGPEMLDAIERRLLDARATRGIVAALALGVKEAWTCVLASVEARRELARAARLGAPRLVGVRADRVVTALARDAAEAGRGVLRAPRSAALVVLIMGLGIGMSASIFSVVDAVLLQRLGFPDSHELVHVWADRSWQDESRGLVADVQFEALESDTEDFAGFAALWMVSGRVLGGARPLHTDVARVSADFFDLLGVEPMLGRAFREGEDRPGAPWVAVLDHAYWVRELAADPGVVGTTLRIGFHDMEVVGVLPPDFEFRVPPELGAHGRPDIWLPWWHRSQPGGRAGGGVLAVVGRIRSGSSMAAAQAELNEIGSREDRRFYQGQGFAYRMEPLQDAWSDQVRPALLVLSVGVGFLLLTAVANAATLLLARAQDRSRELGIRRALGASRWRIARLLLAESCVLFLAGAGLGVWLSWLGTDELLGLVPQGLLPVDPVAVDLRVLGFAMAASLLGALAAAAVPISYAGSCEPGPSLRSATGRTPHQSTVTRRTRNTLVMAQIGFSVILLVGAGLSARTLDRIRAAELGFAEQDRITFNVYLMNDYPTVDDQVGFYAQLRERISGLPGVLAVGGSSALPLSAGAPRAPASTYARSRDVDPERIHLTEGFSTLLADELTAPAGEDWSLVDLSAAQPGYFRAAGISIRQGRGFREDDDRSAPLRVVVDDRLAQRFWDGEDAVGERVWIAGAWREVVGVARHARMVEVREQERPQAYLPHAQVRSGRVSMVVHATGDPDVLVQRIRSQVAEIDPLVPIADVRPMSALVDASLARDRLSAVLLATFAGTAILLVGLGVYGVLAHTVGERSTEIAVRLSTGAGPAGVAGLVLRQGMVLVAGGLLFGGAGALVLARLARPVLYGVAPHDPLTLVVSAAMVVVASLAASWIPALRAVSTDPVRVLARD